jgi:spore maturation protein CgeB
MFCTDDLHQNIIFQDGNDFVLIDHDPVSVAKKVEYYFFHPDELIGLAERGKNLVERAYSDNLQMIPRIQIIERELKAIHSKINSTL